MVQISTLKLKQTPGYILKLRTEDAVPSDPIAVPSDQLEKFYAINVTKLACYVTSTNSSIWEWTLGVNPLVRTKSALFSPRP